ncbi:MAG: hypothetical protein JJD93_10060 [Ilumatobacteraceae bacterium]|nr:hypothetical protein [Ilumatobacteraceae bacterium]
MLRKLLGPMLVFAVIGSAAGVAYASHDHGDGLDKVKQATKQFRSLSVANAANYGLLVDVKGIACIDMPGMGAMGVHYVNGDLVGDGEIQALTPEAVVYEPDSNGRPHLVALEYVVFKDAWDAQHQSKPSLFGQKFNTTLAGNRYGLPAFYSLHVWLYKHNPAGTFAMWNPDVTCTPDDGHDDDGHDGHHGDDLVGQMDG